MKDVFNTPICHVSLWTVTAVFAHASTSLVFILLFLLGNVDGTELEVFLEWVLRSVEVDAQHCEGVKLFL